MRTSRLAQDVSKVAQMLSPRRTRRSLRDVSTNDAKVNGSDTAVNINDAVPATPLISGSYGSSNGIPTPSPTTNGVSGPGEQKQNRKRKRSVDDTKTEETPSRTTNRLGSTTPISQNGSINPIPNPNSNSNPNPDSNPNVHVKAHVNGTPTKISTRTRTSPRENGIKVEQEIDIEETVLGDGVTFARKARRQPAKRVVDPLSKEVTVAPPGNWQEVYQTIQIMRRQHLAPVDTVGCERLADESLSPRDRRYQTLTALMLSSQTKDTTTAMAMNRLRTELPPPGLTVENMLAVDPVRLNKLIRIVGFHNNKTRFLKASAEILRDQFDCDIPKTAEELMTLPGVGPKMAYLCMSAAWGIHEGIGVDVHVHRITNLLGWHKTNNPEETRSWLEAWLPHDKWHEINALMVGFGQTVCPPVGRKCEQCLLAERGLCPSAVVSRKKIVKKIKEQDVKEEQGQTIKTETQELTLEEHNRTVETV